MSTPISSDSTAALIGFPDFMLSTMATWKVPGAAMAIVRNGTVVFAQGFGLRDRERALAVTPNTVFPIASCTKAFTTMGLAILVDEGKLEWDAPVREYLPTFKLHDPVASELMTPRDLVTHRSGLPRHDLMWYKSSRTRQELFDRLRYLEPSKGFRAAFQYNNLMFMVAGHLIDRLSGESWEDFTRGRILEPLGMGHTLFSVVEAQQTEDFARPHDEVKEEVKEIGFYEEQQAIGPAGAIVSSIEDMSHWLLLHLNKGMCGDRRIVSASQIEQLHAPQIALSDAGRYAELPAPVTYGLGWSIQSYRGHTIVQHSGGIDGFTSLVTLLPRENIGVVVLNNLMGPFPTIATFNAIDRLLNLDQVPWSERFMKDHLTIREGEERGEEKSAAEAVPGTSPSHPLAGYTGEFAHPAYGSIEVATKDQGLIATFHGVTRPLCHYHYDIFEMKLEEWHRPIKLSFATGVQGDVGSLAGAFEPAVPDIVFRRLPSSHMLEKSFLERFVGEYSLMDLPMWVTLKSDHVLKVSLADGQEYELAPTKATEFQLAGLNGFRIEFTTDAAGMVTAAILTQPWGVLTATRK